MSLNRLFANQNNGAEALSSQQSPDASLKYNANQERWQEFSKGVYAELQPLLNQPNITLTDAYSFLANKRAKIALELEHGKNESEDRSRWYGQYRDENSTSLENVRFVDERNFPHQQEQIFKHVLALIDSYDPSNNSLLYRLNKSEVEMEYYNFSLPDGKKHPATQYYITFHSPIRTQKIDGLNHSTDTVTIFYIDFHDNKNEKYIQLRYTPINKYNKRGDACLGNKYFQAMRSSNDLNEFLTQSGRLMHLMAQLLRVKLGNAAISEWLVNGMAISKKFELGPYNHSLGIDWDWKALVTPDREEYAKWYAQNAFCYANDLNAKLEIFSNPSKNL